MEGRSNLEFLDKSNGYITVVCKCGQIIKKHKSYCKQYGDEYHFNPPITCSCGNTESVAYKSLINDPSNSSATNGSDKLDIKEVDSYNQKSAQEIGRELLEAHIRSLSLLEKISLRASSAKLSASCLMIDAGSALDGVKDGIVRSLPGYKMGKYEGEKVGYTKASKDYEDKLIKQALKFKEQIISSKEEYEELEKLLDKYEKYISKLEAEIEQLSFEQQKRLQELISNYERLLKIKH